MKKAYKMHIQFKCFIRDNRMDPSVPHEYIGNKVILKSETGDIMERMIVKVSIA